MKYYFTLLIAVGSICISAMGIQVLNQTIEQNKLLNVGDTVINFTAKNQFDSLYVLDSALSKGPLVLVFYRGQWCPFCSKHLSELQDSLDLVIQRGAQVVAISPEKPESLIEMQEKSKASFTLLFDEEYKIAHQFGISFYPDDATIKKYNTFLGADLNNAHNNIERIELPVPATFIINQDKTIRWRHYDPDYKKRASVKSILDQFPIINE